MHKTCSAACMLMNMVPYKDIQEGVHGGSAQPQWCCQVRRTHKPVKLVSLDHSGGRIRQVVSAQTSVGRQAFGGKATWPTVVTNCRSNWRPTAVPTVPAFQFKKRTKLHSVLNQVAKPPLGVALCLVGFRFGYAKNLVFPDCFGPVRSILPSAMPGLRPVRCAQIRRCFGSCIGPHHPLEFSASWQTIAVLELYGACFAVC